MTALEHSFIKTNGISLHVVTAGPSDGQPIVLLHGFPEFWYGWRHQIPYLAQHGYRVIAPDQRGYNLSDKPKAVAAYHINQLAQDAVGLMDALGYERVHLIGHDWGAAVSWWVATVAPERLKKLVILNVPYPSLMIDAYRSGNLAQLLKSWYIFFFQIPWLPEALLGPSHEQGAAQMLRRSGKSNTFDDSDFAEYKKAWSQPGAMQAMINWYRAVVQSGALRQQPTKGSTLRIRVPTLMLWGEQDIALSKELATQSVNLCENGRLIFFPDATHWVQHDEAEAVNRHITEFLAEPAATSG